MLPLDIIRLANERAAETGDNLRPEFHDAVAAMLEDSASCRRAQGIHVMTDADPIALASKAAAKHAAAIRHMQSTQLEFMTLLNPVKS